MTESLSIADLIQIIVDHNLESLFTGLPAKIIKYDPTSQKATVQSLIKRRDRDADDNAKDGLKDMALIQGVPVIFPSAGNGILSFPVKVGDTVLLVYCARSTDNFVYSDGTTPVDPKDFRFHDYNDCFAIPGLYPFKKALGSHPSDVVLRANVGTGSECSIALKPSGDIVATSPTKIISVAPVQELQASTSVKIDSPDTTITGNLRVDKQVSVGQDVQTDAGFSANNHKHIGNLGSPTSTFI